MRNEDRLIAGVSESAGITDSYIGNAQKTKIETPGAVQLLLKRQQTRVLHQLMFRAHRAAEATTRLDMKLRVATSIA